MKKIILSLLFLATFASSGFSQSTMTDKQIIEFVTKEQEKGTEQSQIVTKLMQRGVTIDQIKNLRNKVERQKRQDGLGVKDITGAETSKDRLRKNNADKENPKVSKFRIKDTRKKLKADGTEDKDDRSEEILMFNELNSFMPDSAELYDQMIIEEYENKKKSEKKIFGHDIFNNKDLSFEPNMNIATPENYILGPGDAVYVDVWGASNNTYECTITPDGTLQLDDFGPVNVSGLTVEKANALLRRQLGARFQNSDIRLSLGQTRTISVNVMGEVNVPGTYTLSAFATVFHALYMAGGVNEIGTLRNVRIYRNNKQIANVDIYDYILNGKLRNNIRLADGDVVIISPYNCLVNITGKVKRPMYYEMKESESVKTLLSYSGGFTGDAYKKSIRLVRKSGTNYSVFNVDEFDMATFKLSDGDSLSVDSVLQRYSNMVELKGAVFRPGLYQMDGKINSVRSLLEQADGTTEDAFTAHAVMHRMRPDRTMEVISVDVDGIMAGTTPDIPLRNEDILFIPSKKDQQDQQTLTIHGEVMYPGIYKYASNMTLEDFILQAGGLKDAASIMKVDVARRINDISSTTSTDTIARTYSFALKDGFVVDGEKGFTLLPYDEVYIRTNPSYSEQKNVIIEGEVLYAGTYTLTKKSERLSELIKNAGGLTNFAYPQGARLQRKMTEEERLRQETILKMARAQSGEKDSLDMKKLDIGETYFVGINLDKAIANPGTNYDIVLREGDKLIVPEYSGTVKISGDVMYPNTVAYREGKGINYYIDQAGGWGSRAKKSNTIIIYMNGTVAKAGRGSKPMPGCEIVVPSKQRSQKMSTAEIVALGSGTASIATMIATIANMLK